MAVFIRSILSTKTPQELILSSSSLNCPMGGQSVLNVSLGEGMRRSKEAVQRSWLVGGAAYQVSGEAAHLNALHGVTVRQRIHFAALALGPL